MASVRNVIFDLGGVLLEWQPNKILARCFAAASLQELIRREMLRHTDWIAFDLGHLSEADLVERVRGRTGLKPKEIVRVLDSIRDALVEVPEAVGLLHDIRARPGMSVYCLSNMPMSIFSHVRQRHTFWTAFNGIVVSGDVRMMKPDRAIFEYLLSRYDLSANETIFVDDHPPNIDAARAVGMEAVLFQGAVQCREELFARLARADNAE